MYLITGVFFQEQQWLGTAMHPKDGLTAIVESGLIFCCYSGMITTDSEDPSRLAGGMFDHYGESTLSDINVTEHEVSFTKKYNHRPDRITYVFKKREGDSWIGEYSGTVVGSGISRCILTTVPDDFYDPHMCMEILGRRTAHTWNPSPKF